MNAKQVTHISEEKLKLVKKLSEDLSGKNTVMIASIKGLPARQFQIIKKGLRGKAEVWIVKKRIMLRAIDDSKKEELQKLKEFVKEDIAIITSDEDAFDLAKTLSESKSPVKAKAGQEATEDVEIEAGMTELPVGPAVSELGSVGLTVKINAGKIEIIESRVIVKQGKIISEEVASVMGKLDIMPFSVGFIPETAYDAKSNLIFNDLKIDSEAFVNEMKQIFAKARGFALGLSYICKDTIGMLLSKANSHKIVLEKFADKEPEQIAEGNEVSVEEKEEVKEEIKEIDSEKNKSEEEKNG
ncbi:MAG: 50S ribosomal protein L10 [Nanoarchaeota archaeon]|nr:50S ribosomal protein L10 [Nanoarchaeota archaeon]